MKENEHLGFLDLDGKIMLKSILNKYKFSGRGNETGWSKPERQKRNKRIMKIGTRSTGNYNTDYRSRIWKREEFHLLFMAKAVPA
jgi:hypothetical protein